MCCTSVCLLDLYCGIANALEVQNIANCSIFWFLFLAVAQYILYMHVADVICTFILYVYLYVQNVIRSFVFVFGSCKMHILYLCSRCDI